MSMTEAQWIIKMFSNGQVMCLFIVALLLLCSVNFHQVLSKANRLDIIVQKARNEGLMQQLLSHTFNIFQHLSAEASDFNDPRIPKVHPRSLAQSHRGAAPP